MGKLKNSEACEVLPNALHFTPACTWEQYLHKGRELKTYAKVWEKHFRWWLGDFINYGAERFPEKYTQALEMEFYTIASLRNVSWVCRHVNEPNRLIDDLSFDHHSTVAPLDAEKQKDWLDAAIANDWTVRQLRCAIQGQRVSVNALPRRMPKPGEWEDPDPKGYPDFGKWWTNVGTVITKTFGLEEKSCERIAAQAWHDAIQSERSRGESGESSQSTSG